MSLKATPYCRVSFSIPVFVWCVPLVCRVSFLIPMFEWVCSSCEVGIVFDTRVCAVCSSCVLGIVIDTCVCVGALFFWGGYRFRYPCLRGVFPLGASFPSLIAGYRFRYPCLCGVSLLCDGYRFRYLWHGRVALFDNLVE